MKVIRYKFFQIVALFQTSKWFYSWPDLFKCGLESAVCLQQRKKFRLKCLIMPYAKWILYCNSKHLKRPLILKLEDRQQTINETYLIVCWERFWTPRFLEWSTHHFSGWDGLWESPPMPSFVQFCGPFYHYTIDWVIRGHREGGPTGFSKKLKTPFF